MSFGREHKGRDVRLVQELRLASGAVYEVGRKGVVDRVWRGRYNLSFGGGIVYGVKRGRFEFVDKPSEEPRHAG